MNNLPVIFICENNCYSVYSHISVRQPRSDIALRPKAFDIPSQKIDGMNVFEVYDHAGQAVEHARGGKGPCFLECCVQRWRDHAGSGDTRRAQYRTAEEQDESYWRDPVKEFRQQMSKDQIVSENELNDIDHKLDQEIATAFQFAKESPLPKKEDLEKYLFA
jgi:pyruvate dehydrogenase E1 component alpha subunit